VPLCDLKVVLKWNVLEDLDLQVKSPSGQIVFSSSQPALASGASLDHDDGNPSFFNGASGVETITFPAAYETGTYMAIVSQTGYFAPNSNGQCTFAIPFTLETYVCDVLQTTVASQAQNSADFKDAPFSFEVS
jgi:uncharacterized protein YfaP (DUF2135 family)